jgi:hypothetical protein
MPTPLIIDQGTLKLMETLYPDFKVRMIRVYNDFYDRHKIRLRMTESLRDWERQAKLWAQGRTTPGKIVTKARPGESIHHYGCAADSCFNNGDPYLEKLKERDKKLSAYLWREFGRFVQAHGLVWSGDWNGNGIEDKDDFELVHCQITYGLSLSEIKKLYAFGGLRAVWTRFDQIRGVEIGEGWLKKVSQT